MVENPLTMREDARKRLQTINVCQGRIILLIFSRSYPLIDKSDSYLVLKLLSNYNDLTPNYVLDPEEGWFSIQNVGYTSFVFTFLRYLSLLCSADHCFD